MSLFQNHPASQFAQDGPSLCQLLGHSYISGNYFHLKEVPVNHMFTPPIIDCPILCDPMDCSPQDSSVHGIFQARILEWVAISSSKGIFPTQGSNPCLLHLLPWQVDSLPTAPPGKLRSSEHLLIVTQTSCEVHLLDVV